MFHTATWIPLLTEELFFFRPIRTAGHSSFILTLAICLPLALIDPKNMLLISLGPMLLETMWEQKLPLWHQTDSVSRRCLGSCQTLCVLDPYTNYPHLKVDSVLGLSDPCARCCMQYVAFLINSFTSYHMFLFSSIGIWECKDST